MRVHETRCLCYNSQHGTVPSMVCTTLGTASIVSSAVKTPARPPPPAVLFQCFVVVKGSQAP